MESRMDIALATPEALEKAVAAVARIVEGRRTLPILSHLLLEADTGITVAGTDLTTSLRLGIPADVLGAGRAAVSAQHLGQILRQLPEAPVSLVLTEGDLTLTCEHARFRLRTLPADEFPTIPQMAAEGSRIPAATLRDLLRKTHFAVSQDQTRLSLTGSHIATTGDRLRFTATDGHRLARASTAISGTVPSTIAPPKGLLAAARLIPQQEDGEVQLALDDEGHQLHLRWGPQSHVITRVIDGQFPDVDAVLAEPGAERILVDRATLLGALRRVSPLAGGHHGITLRAGQSALTLSASEALGEATDEIEASITGTPPTVGVNGRYLLDFLEATDAAQVRFALTDALAPVHLEPVGDGSFEHIVMPMRLG
jgi:DNA polymerase-3 subunit beta